MSRLGRRMTQSTATSVVSRVIPTICLRASSADSTAGRLCMLALVVTSLVLAGPSVNASGGRSRMARAAGAEIRPAPVVELARPRLALHPAVAALHQRGSITVTGMTGASAEVRLLGATTSAGKQLPWVRLRAVGRAWEGTLPRPALRGIYPVQLRVRRGSRVFQSRAWLYRVFQRGTASRPTFASPEGVVRWWVRFVRHRVAVALKRWPRPTFDLRDRRLHQLLVVAYRRAGDLRVSHRLGMFVTAVRDGFDGRWRLLEATAAP